ncbi:MAG: fluoride efflux transporter CrcB [Chromatiales bacterium]|nr:MAG: fluoride efflux transporter CrcB [Chromatiales bacterium]
MELRVLAWVALGGAIGSVLRFTVGGWAQRMTGWSQFPVGTLVVNVLGCLLIGLIGGLADYRQVLDPGQRAFLMIGVLGGFTTFSAFAFETLGLMQDGALLRAGVNVVLQTVLGLTAATVGYVGARFL